MHEFRKTLAKLVKQQENNANKIFIKIEILWGTISNIIFFTKKYFSYLMFS